MYNIIKKEILKSKLIIVSFIIMGIGFIILYNQVLIPRYTDVVYLRMVTYPVLLGIIVSICGYATFLNTEKYENKNNGYEFLKNSACDKAGNIQGKDYICTDFKYVWSNNYGTVKHYIISRQ
jgi:hypothetical protein